MSKLFQKTVSFTFTVEHVSDDPRCGGSDNVSSEYEKELIAAIETTVENCDLADRFHTQLIRRGLQHAITAGGWGVKQDSQAISDAVYKLRDAIIRRYLLSDTELGQKIEALADEVVEKSR